MEQILGSTIVPIFFLHIVPTGIAGNHWNGMSKGVNKETKEDGLYPGFKTVEKVETAPFELFQEEH